jgi:hypothetical protein
MIKKIFRGIAAGINWLFQDTSRRRKDESFDIWEELEHTRARYVFGGMYKRFTKRFEGKGIKREDEV